jgi:hypothetical protein
LAGGATLAFGRGMRSLMVVLMVVSSGANARERHVHDGGLDTGGKVAVSGAVIFSMVYSATAMTTSSLDGLSCALYDSEPCLISWHTDLEIPAVGGFVYAAHHGGGTALGLGLASSAVQLSGVGMLVGGLIAHHWRVPDRRVQLLPYVSPTGAVGISARF